MIYLVLPIVTLLASCTTITKKESENPLASIKSEFVQKFPNYANNRKRLKKDLEKLERTVFETETKGEEISCASQILSETSWLLGYTGDFQRIETRLRALEAELNKNPHHRMPDSQSSETGAWGRCFTEWFFKLSLSGDHILNLAEEGRTPKYVPKFLDEINSPEKLKTYLDSILITDVSQSSRINRRELNESVSTLVRLIIKRKPNNFKFHPQLEETLLNYIHDYWQDKDSGYWGAWVKRTDGSIVKTADLSITFHLVSYLKGKVAKLDKIFKTTLAIKNNEYPFGWLDDGKYYENHHNYDVVRLLRYGWPEVSESDRKAASTEIRKMLDWCLSSSLQAEGSFIRSSSDDSIEDSYYFGVSFLDEVGYFKKEKRFWTNEDFAGAESLREKLIKNIRKAGTRGGKSGVYYKSALEKLDATSI